MVPVQPWIKDHLLAGNMNKGHVTRTALEDNFKVYFESRKYMVNNFARNQNYIYFMIKSYIEIVIIKAGL